jgi:peptidylprolyl isomerase
MKFTMPALIVAGALLVQTAGCSNNDNSTTQPVTAATSSTPTEPVSANTQGPPLGVPSSPSSTSTAPGSDLAVDNTSVPDTTTINGKKVTLKKMADGLRYYDITVGTGPNPKIGQTVSVQYTGTLLDGTKFDSSYDHGGTPIDFAIGVGQVIKGWDEGVPPMRVGGKRRLVIPGFLAYGANPPTPTIPPNATLVFDIELVAVK